MGRPKGTYKFTVEEVEKAWQEYKARCKAHVKYEVSAGKKIAVPAPRVYTLEAFQVFLGISHQAWSEYRSSKRFGETIKKIEAEVFSRKKDALVNAEGSTTGLIFDMKANYGINDKTVIDANVSATITQVAPQVVGSPVPVAKSEKDVEI
jgi:hypothetical protein